MVASRKAASSMEASPTQSPSVAKDSSPSKKRVPHLATVKTRKSAVGGRHMQRSGGRMNRIRPLRLSVPEYRIIDERFRLPSDPATKRQEKALDSLVTNFMLERCLLQFPEMPIENLVEILKIGEKAIATMVKKHKPSYHLVEEYAVIYLNGVYDRTYAGPLGYRRTKKLHMFFYDMYKTRQLSIISPPEQCRPNGIGRNPSAPVASRYEYEEAHAAFCVPCFQWLTQR